LNGALCRARHKAPFRAIVSTKKAGVRRITSHGARHTAGSSYTVMGAGQKVIGTLLGHSDSASTERYTHIAPSATTAMVEARWQRLCGTSAG
jgi:integrase